MPEILQLTYDYKDKIVNYVRRGIEAHQSLYRKPYMSEWIKSPTRRCVDKLVFQFDNKSPSNTFNLFQGLRVERQFSIEHLHPSFPVNMAVVQPFLDLIRMWGEKDVYEYLLL